MRAPVIRISIGRFDAELAAQVEARLLASKERLEPGVRALSGNLGYFVGVDHANNAMHNVSMWETVADAHQMASFEPMKKLGAEFSEMGVRFDRPIMNFDTLWQFE
jgi:hypothetical protein